MCILDLSKVLMCEFHNDYIKNKYGKNSRLLFTCLMYETKAGKNENMVSWLRRLFNWNRFKRSEILNKVEVGNANS